METIKETLVKAKEYIVTQARALVAKVDLFIMGQPKTATLVALAVGIVLGLCWANYDAGTF